MSAENTVSGHEDGDHQTGRASGATIKSVERGIGRGSTAPTATGEGVDSMSNYGQHGQQTPTNSDGPQPSSHLHRDPDDRDHVDLRQTQESDDGERSCPEPRAEPEGEVASNDEPSAPDSRRQLGEPQHTSDAKGNNTPQQPGCTSASGNERVQPQKPPGEPCGVPKAPPEKQKQKPKTDKEWARHWYEKSGSHEAEVKKLQNAISKLRKNFAEEREQLDSTREELFREKTRLKKRLDTLQTSHIHSVNSVGTGLEPISDQTFEDRFRALQDEVNVWCRKLFKRKGQICGREELHEDSKSMILARVYSHEKLTFPYLMELVAWAFMEKYIFSTWFPGLPENVANQMTELQSWVRPGDNNKTPEKAEYWRAYTKSLLFQNPSARECIQDVLPLSTHLLDHLLWVQVGENKPVNEYMEAVQKSLVNARILAAELGCQRGVYEIDDDISIGDKYDDSRMTDAMFTAEVGERVIVYCILSKGWVKRAYMGAKKIDVRICKARVIVGTARQGHS